MKTTKGKLFELQEGFDQVSNLRGAKFVYAAAKNKRKVDAECEDISKAIAPTEEYVPVQEKERELVMTHCLKDAEGNPVPNNQGNLFVPAKNDKAYKADREKLKAEHKEIFEKRDKQTKDYEELLKGEIEIELHMIKEEDLPEDITAGQLAGIMDMVE